MSLYSNWTDMVVEYVKTKGEKAFWDEYSAKDKGLKQGEDVILSMASRKEPSGYIEL